MKKVFLGIEIGGTKLQIFICNNKAFIIKRWRLIVGDTKEASEIREAISNVIIHEIIPQYTIEAIGIGFGGPVNKDNGNIIESYQVNGWSSFDLSGWMKQIVDVPVYIENDANLAALSEALIGAGKNANRVFYITIGSGIGGGFIINKSIYHGAGIAEAEIGHLRLSKEGSTLQSECSGWAIDQKIRSAIKEFPSSKLAYIIGNETHSEAKYLKKAILEECDIANNIFSELTDNLAYCISHVIHLLNPDMIIIGGGLSLIGEMLTNTVEQKTSKLLMSAMLPCPKISLPELNEDVVVMGAILLAIEKYKTNN